MKKKTKKFFALLMVLIITLSNFMPFISMIKVGAKELDPNDIIELQLDGANISGNTITFEEGNIVANISTTNDKEYEIDGTSIKVKYQDIGDLKITFIDKEGVHVFMNQGESNVEININGDNEIVLVDFNYNLEDRPHIQIQLDNNNDPVNPNNPVNQNDTYYYRGNGESTLNYSVNGAIEYTSGGGFDNGITFRINGIPYRMPDKENPKDTEEDYADFFNDDLQDGKNYTETFAPACERNENGQCIEDEHGNPIPILDPDTMQPMEEKVGYEITGDTIHYSYDTNINKVSFTFAMAPGTLMTSLKINGTSYDLPNSKEELQACYIDHRLEITINDVDYADTYNIQIEARYPNSNEEFMGNFLWDYNPEGYTGPDDKILNATMTFVEAKYGNETYTTPEEIEELGGVFIWKDAERKDKYSNENERDGVGEAQFPVGTELTVRIIPDAGYQLVDFGINGGVFTPQEEIGTYTFTVQGGPFHLQANIEKVDDSVNASSEKIESGSIVLDENEDSMNIGTARLDVDDVTLTKEQIDKFKKAANSYEVDNYLDISLFNTVFKGSEEESWDTEVRELEKEATITLKLEEGINGNEVVIVHEKHDGTYEVIPVEYNPKSNTITFKTNSFSNYAIASKGGNPKTFDAIYGWMLITFVSMIGMYVSLNKYKRILKGIE